ncbi:hypothetical protein GCM10022419_136610 [Nonomuraea rosea]|uniref:Uncharacterized protein n=1 Tax=Nonomuraea rosea TaxID=638574 RepID=A0ABP7ABU8_9ACTN
MDNSAGYSAKLGAEIHKLEEAGLTLSPELLINATEPTESLASAGDPYHRADSPTTARGYWIGSLAVLGAATEAESVVEKLRQRTAAAPDTADEKARLLELWIAAEPLLSEAELQEVRPIVLRHLFGDDEGRVNLSRNSGDAQGGGY